QVKGSPVSTRPSKTGAGQQQPQTGAGQRLPLCPAWVLAALLRRAHDLRMLIATASGAARRSASWRPQPQLRFVTHGDNLHGVTPYAGDLPADYVRVVSRLVSRVVTDRSASYAWQPAERACAGNRPFGR